MLKKFLFYFDGEEGGCCGGDNNDDSKGKPESNEGDESQQGGE